MNRLLLPILALTACVAPVKPTCPVSYTDSRYQYGGDITAYPAPDLSKLGRSPRGVPIGPGVDGYKVDAAFDSVAKCLGITWQACGVRAVRVAPDTSNDQWTGASRFPCALTRQTAPLHSPLTLYTAPPEQFYCTGVNQWPATIYITPNHQALTWEVERMLTRDTPANDPKKCWQAPGQP